MPLNPKIDPRYFVLIRPLPNPPQKGLKIQARSKTIYNCWDVPREQVFRESYHRRAKQLSQQGYFTPCWKPYQDFGDPLYLDPRKLTLYGLGQLPPLPRARGIIVAQQNSRDSLIQTIIINGNFFRPPFRRKPIV